MKRTLIYIVLFISVIAIGVYYVFFAPKYIRTSHSPDGEYTLRIYERPKWISMPGDGGTKCAKLKLYKGWWPVMNDCPRCPAFTNDMDVRWDMEAGQVWFAKARTIDLETGECRQ